MWNIVYDSDSTVTAGDFKLTSGGGSAYATLANSWLSHIDGTGPKANIVALSSTTAQDQITTPNLPLPSSFWAGLSLMGGVATMWKVRQLAAAFGNVI